MATANIDGIGIDYRESGSGIPLVWIHGFPLSSDVFERQMTIEGCRHIAPDLPGFGRSDRRPAMTIDSYADVVIGLLDEIAIPAAVFAGLSMGGYIVFAIARKAKERMRGVILIDTRETPDSEEGRRGRHEMIAAVRSHGPELVVEQMLPKMLTPETIEQRPEVRERLEAIMKSASTDGVIASLSAMADRADSTPLLPQLNIPALVAVGARDAVTPLSDAERMARALPDATLLTIPDAAHLSNFEQPAVFNEAVKKFLERIVETNR